MPRPIRFLLRLPLVGLRRLADRIGQGGGAILMGAGIAGPMILMSPTSRPTTNLVLVLIMIGTAWCAIARHRDGAGHRAMRRLRDAASKVSDDDARLARWLGVDPAADVRTIKSAARRRMMEGHPDHGGHVDMHDVVRVRDHLVARAGRTPPPPSPAALLAAWRESSGRGGQLWGAALPSQRLVDLRKATGESLWPRFRDR